VTTPKVPSSCVIMLGSIADGFSSIGPFSTAAAAHSWAAEHCAGNGDAGDVYDVLPLTPPESAQASV